MEKNWRDVEFYKDNDLKTTRDLFGQDKGRQAYMVIQSFKPGEITAESTNEIGVRIC
ncbi:relaxase/mobilization nuclease domain-containing protein (plasmid) [Bacillus toyonensis]